MTEAKGARFLDCDCDKGLWQSCASADSATVTACFAKCCWQFMTLCKRCLVSFNQYSICKAHWASFKKVHLHGFRPKVLNTLKNCVEENWAGHRQLKCPEDFAASFGKSSSAVSQWCCCRSGFELCNSVQLITWKWYMLHYHTSIIQIAFYRLK